MRCSSGIMLSARRTCAGKSRIRGSCSRPQPWRPRRIRLGTAITPVARRRPSKLAREVATLDRLTGGRMILGAGLGAPVADEYGSFGDTTDIRVLAERLDEGLHALDLLVVR